MMKADLSPSRQAGNRLITAHAKSQVQTFFDEIKNGTRNYQTVASLDSQLAQEYRGRCILELLQNAHDALAEPEPNDPRCISFVLYTSPEPVLLIGNTGHPFHLKDFKGVCQLAQSPKDPNKSIGNKGLGFRSVLEICGCPEIWSTTPTGSDTCFAFRFDPAAIDKVAEAAQIIERHGLDTRSPFDTHSPLVDWSQEHLDQFRQSVAETGIDISNEAKKFLSPYLLPLTVAEVPHDVQRLLDAGHATVVRLCLDGGRMLAGEEAVQSVKKQLDDLRTPRSVVFLEHVSELAIEVEGDRYCLRRTIDSDVRLAGHLATRQRLVKVESVGPSSAEVDLCNFHIWTRLIGGNDDPSGANDIVAAVKRLPNRWPEVRQATLGIAVEDTPAVVEGVFVIFLPTEKATGTGAHINAPFYGTLDRRQIDFNEAYNELILDGVLDLCIDTVGELISGQAELWRARAVLDVVASTTVVGGEEWDLMSKLKERAEKRGNSLVGQAVVLCNDGWRTPGEARLMPYVSDDDLIGAERWRSHAEFSIVAAELDGRRDAITKLLENTGGSVEPTQQEWIDTIERIAQEVYQSRLGINWNDFLCSLLAVLPDNLLVTPLVAPDPLAKARFLPTSDGQLVSASDTVSLFFRPVQGLDDAGEFIQDVPDALQGRIAFLHSDVQTHEDQAHRNTEVQKFLDGRFIKTYRREDILRDVVIPALPSLPVPHGSPEAVQCAEILAWTFKLVGGEPQDTLLPLLRQLPVCCYDNWLPVDTAVFGTGWPGRHGNDIRALADELPNAAGHRLRGMMLRSPSDERWLVDVNGWDEFFARVGVVDGLQLQIIDVTFEMNKYSSNDLLEKLPSDTPREAWEDWYNTASETMQPCYVGWHKYKLSDLRLLPEIHHLAALKQLGHRALSNLLLRSIGRWNANWDSVTIRKRHGESWQAYATSPLKHWLQSISWLSDRDENAQLLSQRWLVPESLLRGQSGRYAHLDPLSLDLVKRLDVEPVLKERLVTLGLNIYPTEDDKTGPELLNALARAWTSGRVPAGRFDVFLGQVREAWRFLDPDRGLPDIFLVRTGRRSFSARCRGEMADVFLPDSRDRSRALRDHERGVLEMEPRDASELAGALVEATGINLASQLEEQHMIDGSAWRPDTAETMELDAAGYEWLPVILLAVAAYGGTNPAGATTGAWREAADRLRRTCVVECDEIVTKIVHNNDIVAESQPLSQWLPGDVLAVRRDLESHEGLALAGQAILNRQDISKDLRLVLGALPAEGAVTSEDMKAALDKAEIDAQAFADIYEQWVGDMSIVVDRIRPVLRLLQISEHGFEAAARDADHLAEWLSANLRHWGARKLLAAARRSSHDDHAMGMAAWRALGEVAQLSKWNAALAELGDKYEFVENTDVSEQTTARLDEATPELRAFARHVALAAGDPTLFRRVEVVAKGFAGEASWSKQWWDVPFAAILNSLTTRYKQDPALAHYIDLIEGSKAADRLRARLEERGISITPDPYETADSNRHRLDQLLSDLRDLYQAWLESSGSSGAKEVAERKIEFDGCEHLEDWSDAKLLEMALQILNDQAFKDACAGYSTLDAIRHQLDLTPQAIEARRNERLHQQREAERQRRTHVVAGHSFEVDTTNYRDLFDRLSTLAPPTGPHASKDELTTLLRGRERKGERAGGGPGGSNAPPVHPPSHLTELIGVAGEIWAFQYLRSEFGETAVKHECWVSEIRRNVLPPAEDDPHDINDSHGFDFRFTDRQRRKWHVEVKATVGDDSSFDLGISEIRAATQLARTRGGRWRILRVRNALSEQPEVDWLPNPFEDGFKDRFRLHRGGMRVSYSRQR